MSNGMLAIAQGVKGAANTNMQNQFTTALTLLNLIMIYLPLQQKWSKVLSKDAEDIFDANVGSVGKPGGTAHVASLEEKRNTDSTESDRQTGLVNTIIQGQKGQARLLGSGLQNTYSMQEPVNQLLRSIIVACQMMV